MQISSDKKCALFITDIDNTIFDWVAYYVHAFRAMMGTVERVTNIPYSKLAQESSVIFGKHHSIEYPFVIQELPSVIQHYGKNIDAMLQELVEPAREEFKRVGLQYLTPYVGVSETLKEIKKKHPSTPLVALTDAPRYVAMWKLNKLGLLHDYDAVYGLADPRLPTDLNLGRVKVNSKILLKHLQQSNFSYQGKIRILPEDYEKPGSRGLKTVLMDFDIDENPEAKSRTIWIGDNLRKDVGLGKRVGVKTYWARYGTKFDPELMPLLQEFSPPENVQKNVSLDPKGADSPKPDHILDQISDVLSLI